MFGNGLMWLSIVFVLFWPSFGVFLVPFRGVGVLGWGIRLGPKDPLNGHCGVMEALCWVSVSLGEPLGITFGTIVQSLGGHLGQFVPGLWGTQCSLMATGRGNLGYTLSKTCFDV